MTNMKHKPYGLYEAYIKRIQDFICAFIAIILLSPVLLVVAILVRTKLGSPILFVQERPGLNGKVFKLYKFRTMLPPKDGEIDPLQDAQRLTSFGKKLRSTSLDELPELFNILKGDMSIVGPRPALWNQEDLISERDKYNANDIRPGLTGWAQINGRDELEIPEKAKLDGEYVSRESFMFDILCIIRTVTSVFAHKGVVEGRTGAMK